jgi:hypothetical protein
MRKIENPYPGFSGGTDSQSLISSGKQARIESAAIAVVRFEDSVPRLHA